MSLPIQISWNILKKLVERALLQFIFQQGNMKNRTTNSVEGLWSTCVNTCIALRSEQFVVPFFAGLYKVALGQIQNSRSRAESWNAVLSPWATEALLTIRKAKTTLNPLESPPHILIASRAQATVTEIKTGHTFVCEARTQKCSCTQQVCYSM